ncbi:MAG: glycoside hydrolase family 9 protein [Oscillospiraceae bacterium]|nr:glycoside hydrolase family 9 protein [Oscillospiraceae bacterium]
MNRKYFDRDITQIGRSPFGILVDQAGYEPDSKKTAVIPFECDSFEVTDPEGKVCYTSGVCHHGYDEDSGDDVYTADLSGFRKEGTYRVRAKDRMSAAFEIKKGVYETVLDDTLKAFYYLRCGCGLDSACAGEYAHGKCHTEKAVLWEDHGVSLDVTGGWHDAGDYGRYVTAGACAAAHLLYAFRMFPAAYENRDINIPEKGMPDILSECKYELEWLMKMQSPDGGAYHKATTALHAPFIMPELDKEQVYVFPVSSMATADLAAVCALAAGIYEKYDRSFSAELFQTALKAADWLDAHPEFIGFRNPEGCNTGGYGEGDDLSNRFWAYAEMYAVTGKEDYHEKMLSFADRTDLTGLGYADIGGLGSLSYLLSEQKKDEELVSAMKRAFGSKAAELKDLSDKSGYHVAMRKREYCWGSNMNTMKNGMIFVIDGYFNGQDNKTYAEGQVHYLLGANALGISYVTGTGEYCCNYPHLRPAFADGIEKCMPGMVAGGPNSRPGDPYAVEVIKEGTPPMKCYADDAASYSLNEITIYWNSPTVFVLGYLCGK